MSVPNICLAKTSGNALDNGVKYWIVALWVDLVMVAKLSNIRSHPNIRRLSSTVKYICWKSFYFVCIFVKNLSSLKVLYFINPSHKCMLTTANKTGFAYVCSLHILWMKISYPVYLKLVQFLLILFLISCLVFKTSLARCFRNYFHIHKSFSQKKKYMHSSFCNLLEI